MYDFSLLQFVPSSSRGEFINVGVIAGDNEAGDWDLRILSNLKRAKAIDTEGLLSEALAFVAQLDERLPDDESDGRGFQLAELRGLAADMNNILQITDPRPVVAGDAAEALDIVCRDMLLDPATSVSHRYRNARTAVGAAAHAYRTLDVPDDSLKRSVAVSAGHAEGIFNFAVHNGRAVQLAKCYSFELPDQKSLAQDIMAWAWLANEVRTHGATITTKTGEKIAAPSEVGIACVYVPPRAEEDAPAFEVANEAFSELHVTAAEYRDAESVARIAAEELAAVA